MSIKLFKTHKGQTILEITISLGIALAVVTGLIITTVNGLRNSQFSKNQAQATKFAQEGIDIVRAIKDRKYPVCLNGDTLPTCNSHTWTDLISTNFTSSNNTFILQQNAACPNSSSYCLIYRLTPEDIPNTVLKRLVTIDNESSSPPQKKISSVVSWTDASGTHQSKLVTVLGN